MRTIRFHPHTGQPLVPLGRRKDGRLIWPIIGASEDDPVDQVDAPDEDPDDQDLDEDLDDSGDDPDEDPDGAEELGDAGKKALDRMKARLKDERAKRREAEQKLAERDGDDEQAKRDREAIARANKKIVSATVKAAAKGVLADPADAYKFLDLDQFEVDDDGNVDEDEITEAIDALIQDKPYLAAQGGRRFKGSADGGPRNEAKSRQLTQKDLDGMTAEEVVKARQEGRLDRLLGRKP